MELLFFMDHIKIAPKKKLKAHPPLIVLASIRFVIVICYIMGFLMRDLVKFSDHMIYVGCIKFFTFNDEYLIKNEADIELKNLIN
jgi:hypothetical protein